MRDTHEPGKPRFLAPSDEEAPDSNYQGRFLGSGEAEPEAQTQWISFDASGEEPPIPRETEQPHLSSPEVPQEPDSPFTEADKLPDDSQPDAPQPQEAVPISFEEIQEEEPKESEILPEPTALPPEEASAPAQPEDVKGSVPEQPDGTLAAAPEASPAETPQPDAADMLPSVSTLDPLADFDLSILLDEEPEKQEPQVLPASPEDEEEFHKYFQPEDKKPEEPTPLRTHPAKKGRPKNKKGEGLWGIPNILVTAVWIVLTLAIGITLGRMAWICAADVLAFGREDRPVTVTVTTTDTIEDVANKLHSSGLIRYPGLFKLYARFAVDEGEIKPGIWDLNALYDYHALVSMMSPSSKRSVVTVMIPEGSSCRQVFELLQDKRVSTIEALEKGAMEGDFSSYWFLEDLDQSSRYCLEGYLFPDTYEFYTNDSPQNVLEKLLNNFDKRVDEELRKKLDSLNEQLSQMMRKSGKNADYIASHQLTMADVITVASLIEKESATAKESYTIASVIYNRLYRWGNTPPYLNIDAAVIYGLDGKTDLTAEDLQTDTPYNTYLHTGLTPGPITNPGLNSIKAALEPESTDYYYYVLDMNSGVHHFSKTLEEHEAFRASNKG